MTERPTQIHRHLVYRNLTYGTAGRFNELQRAKNELLTGAGLRPYAVWCPALGGLHHMTLVCDFPSLDAFQRQGQALGDIDGYKQLNAQQMELVIVGTARDEMLKLEVPA